MEWEFKEDIEIGEQRLFTKQDIAKVFKIMVLKKYEVEWIM